MKISDSHNDLSCIELDNIFWESLLALEDLVELSSSDEGHNKVETELRLEQIIHAHKEGVIATEQNIFLELSIIDLVILEENIFSDRLYGIKLLILLQFSKVDFAECASAEYDNEFEVFKLDILLLPGCNQYGLPHFLL
jgi:hypothetical protein